MTISKTSRIIIVSNRLPLTLHRSGARWRVRQSTGGLATGLSPLRDQHSLVWIGWSGVTDSDDTSRSAIEQVLVAKGFQAVHLTSDDVQGFYTDYSNGQLWPLYHYQIDRLDPEMKGWEAYERVNQIFADAIIEAYQPGDVVWIHDYQLQLVPAMVRARLAEAPIAFFSHVPFPSSEIFRILPQKQQILEGLLGADVIGFHTNTYVNNFNSAAQRFAGATLDAEYLHFGGREITTLASPLGIDSGLFDDPGKLGDSSKLISDLRDSGVGHVLLAVDRLDYTKGIIRRLLALSDLLERHPELIGNVTLIQVAAPTREEVEAYRRHKRDVEAMVAKVNNRFSKPGYKPVVYLNAAHGLKEVAELYRDADVMLVTPLRDGLNLVAKEFVASRVDECGVLVLSELAGVSEEMGEALLVNPYDIRGTSETIYKAILMPTEQQRVRMAALRLGIASSDCHTWAETFLEKLDQQVQRRPSIAAKVSDAVTIARDLSHENRLLLFLDYDGTLTPICDSPDHAKPDADLLTTLGSLACLEDVDVHIVSGRPRDTLDSWLGSLPVNLHAEHGAWTRLYGSSEWTTNPGAADVSWMPMVREIMDRWSEKCPGATVEEKSTAIAWHFRLVSSIHGQRMADELAHILRERLSGSSAKVTPGKAVVEVLSAQTSKGKIVQRVLSTMPPDVAVVVIGDDTTDEDMFRVVDKASMNIVVGDHSSLANERIKGPGEVLELLRMLALLRRRRALAEGLLSERVPPLGSALGLN